MLIPALESDSSEFWTIKSLSATKMAANGAKSYSLSPLEIFFSDGTRAKSAVDSANYSVIKLLNSPYFVFFRMSFLRS